MRREPTRAWLFGQAATDTYLGSVFADGAEGMEGDRPVLLIPLDPESAGALYDRLALAFSGRIDRYALASLALDALGIQAEHPAPADTAGDYMEAVSNG